MISNLRSNSYNNYYNTKYNNAGVNSQAQADAKAKYEQEQAKKEQEAKQQEAQQNKDFYSSLIDKINEGSKEGERVTSENASIAATQSANAEQLQSFSAGLNKSQAASLGNAVLGSTAVNDYAENIDTNNQNARDELNAYVESILKARGKTTDLSKLTEVNNLEDQQDWINGLLTIANTGLETANTFLG